MLIVKNDLFPQLTKADGEPPASYPDVARRLYFDQNVRAKEGGKDCTLPMVPCSSSRVTRVSSSRKRCAWEAGWLTPLTPSYHFDFTDQETRRTNQIIPSHFVTRSFKPKRQHCYFYHRCLPRFITSPSRPCLNEKLDLPTSRTQKFSRARSASGRFLMFSVAKATERSRALGPTTGTGNEKRRTLKKS